MTRSGLTRRAVLALGCSAAASPLVTPIALAAAPWDARLVVIVLRGGMDGLDVVQPYGDPDLAELRTGKLAPGPEHGSIDLDGFHALHPSLSPLKPLWDRGELGFAHAVATPYRDKRSHFDGQDLLEAGVGFGPDAQVPREGWLNRMLQVVPGVEAETAFAIGREDMLVMSGPAPVSNWAPEVSLGLSPQLELLLGLVTERDPLIHASVQEAVELARSQSLLEESVANAPPDPGMASMMAMADTVKGGHMRIARFAVERLRADTRLAAFSLNGWDTHARQNIALPKALTQLAEVLEAMRLGLGDVWSKTAVLAMTEFGRTARINGSGGTDHGTGGVMLMAGGAVRGGRVQSAWPGLSEADLYDRRDLMPTEDVRGYAASTMRGLFGLDRSVLETAVFPGLDMGGVPDVIL